jgi:nucleoside-diphosphate-sugar epimerase
MSGQATPFVILGCGYVGTRLAQVLLADGVRVRVCARRTALLEPLQALGAEVHYMDASRPHQFAPALAGLSCPAVVYCIPGVPTLPQGEAVRRAANAALRVAASSFVYLSSSAVYGRSELPFTADWVDEDTSIAIGDADAMARLSDEAALQTVAQTGLRSVVLRLGAIYGPTLDAFHTARGARQRLRAGQYKLWDGGKHYFSRIYIEDLVRIVRAAVEKAPPGAVYCVGDDRPCLQSEYAAWLSSHLGLPMPPDVDSTRATGPRNIIRGRRLRNDKLKRELGLSLLFPSFEDGERAIDQTEAPREPAAAAPNAKSPAQPTPDANCKPAEAAPAVAEPVVRLPAQTPLGDQDVGVWAGGAARGVCVVRATANQALPLSADTAYILLSGAAQIGATSPSGRADKTEPLVPGHGVPPGTPITAQTEAVFLSVKT